MERQPSGPTVFSSWRSPDGTYRTLCEGTGPPAYMPGAVFEFSFEASGVEEAYRKRAELDVGRGTARA
jgi:hypothetical protein